MTGRREEFAVTDATIRERAVLAGIAAPLAFVLALSIALPALAQDTTEDSATEAPAAEADATEEAAPEPIPLEEVTLDLPVATIDGEDLSFGEVLMLRQGLPDQYQQLPDEILTRGLIEQLIDQKLLAKKAEEAGIDQAASVDYALRNNRRSVLAEAYLRAEVEARVTEAAVRAIYDEEIAAAEPVTEVQASHILVETEEAAQALIDELEGGAEFAALAAEHGTDGTAQRGGDLGFFAREEMVPPFAEAAFALETGALGGPVETQFGWHVILKTGERDRAKPTFEELAPQIVRQLQQETQREVITELREAAEVVMSEPGVAPGAIRNDALFDDAGGQ
ncbi:MAG: peptidylprolyl isomerase [Pseudomonadota bacterium]